MDHETVGSPYQQNAEKSDKTDFLELTVPVSSLDADMINVDFLNKFIDHLKNYVRYTEIVSRVDLAFISEVLVNAEYLKIIVGRIQDKYGLVYPEHHRFTTYFNKMQELFGHNFEIENTPPLSIVELVKVYNVIDLIIFRYYNPVVKQPFWKKWFS